MAGIDCQIIERSNGVEDRPILLIPNGFGDLESENGAPLAKRESLGTCNMEAFIMNQAVSPLDLLDNFGLRDVSNWNASALQALQRRTMTSPGTNMVAFYRREMKRHLGYDTIVYETAKGDVCTGTYAALADTAISLGTPGLCGCTVMVIVSRSAVYTGQYWENIALSPSETYLNDHGGTSEEAFQVNVIQGIVKGKKGAQDSLKVFAKSVNKGGRARGYLIVPDTPSENTPGLYDVYKQRWAAMRRTVGELIPELAEPDPATSNPLWTEIKYTALANNDKKLATSWNGKMLFKYDPNHEGQRQASLWVEGDPTDKHGDRW